MTQIKVFCDMCGEQIHEGRTHMLIKTGAERLKRPELDLCLDCSPKVFAMIDHRPESVTAPSPRGRVGRDPKAGGRRRGVPAHA